MILTYKKIQGHNDPSLQIEDAKKPCRLKVKSMHLFQSKHICQSHITLSIRKISKARKIIPSGVLITFREVEIYNCDVIIDIKRPKITA